MPLVSRSVVIQERVDHAITLVRVSLELEAETMQAVEDLARECERIARENSPDPRYSDADDALYVDLAREVRYLNEIRTQFERPSDPSDSFRMLEEATPGLLAAADAATRRNDGDVGDDG